jgi:hypothetical protein
MPYCYTDRLSARPAETVSLHASASASPCTLEVTRVGRERDVVRRIDGLAVGNHPIPKNAGREGCGWPVAREIEIGDWLPGYYDIALSDANGETAHHFVVVKAPRGQARAKAVLALSTNTYQAYNYFGGANAYADVDALMSGAPMEQWLDGAIGVLSAQRPFPQNLVASPDDVPRLITLRKRGFEERPFALDGRWVRAHNWTPYDGSAGFVNKWEHAFVRWAESNDIAFDYLTDYDLDAEPDVLDDYDVVVLVGHSEYWSGPQRDNAERFVDRGGKLAIFSGNTCFWKVRWEDNGRTMIDHKWRGFTNDPIAKDNPSEATHLWSHPAFARPEAQLTGLSFLFGGYHRLGNCVSRGQAGYTIYNHKHWALAGTDLGYGDVIGDEIPLLGYENDGCRFTFGEDGLPGAVPHLGVPEDLEIIALAPCAFGEEERAGYVPIIPPEQLDVVAEIMYGDSSAESQAKVLRGHAVIASFRRGAGEVFNCGTTEWAHGLAAGNVFIERITRNVLERFGAV